ncbi:ABC transporter ATP-binding protein [Albidovulum sp.]|uniref:ABC transporter ATP-binding protein n=1 Tax=Albidovulum sp. TaxID=1872424 RepID=UPI0039B8D907
MADRERGAAVDIRAVTKTYGSFTALERVSLRIEAGQFMTFLGPSGSGKTTTLNVIAGFTGLTEGEILIGGRSVGNLPAHKRNVGVVFQHYALFPHMTVEANVAYPLKLRRVPPAERRRRVARTLDMVRLTDFVHRYPAELSGGQQQRVALARAMVFDPPLLLMDEPLGALDKKLREWLQLEIKRIHRELGTTFVYVTHDQEEALALSDRIAVFNRGRIEQVGSGRDLYENPKTLFVGRFIGESTVLAGPHEVRGGETVLRIGDERVSHPCQPSGAGRQTLLVRPEKITLRRRGAGPAPGGNRLSGRVSEAIYLGSGVKYEVTLADGTRGVARMALTDAPFALGDPVEIGWMKQDARLLPDDGSSQASQSGEEP